MQESPTVLSLLGCALLFGLRSGAARLANQRGQVDMHWCALVPNDTPMPGPAVMLHRFNNLRAAERRFPGDDRQHCLITP